MSELIAFTNDDHYKVIFQIAPHLDSVYVGMLVCRPRRLARSGRTLTITGAKSACRCSRKSMRLERETSGTSLIRSYEFGDLCPISASHEPETQVGGRDADRTTAAAGIADKIRHVRTVAARDDADAAVLRCRDRLPHPRQAPRAGSRCPSTPRRFRPCRQDHAR